MRSLTALPSTALSFIGEVSFSKTDGFIRSLVSLQIGNDMLVREAPRYSLGDSAFFATIATALADTERQCSGPLPELPLRAICDESPAGHPLNWLNVSERKRSDEPRQSHEWYVTLEDEGVRITFEHGKFGYRRESFDRWSAAFARLAELMAGTVTWLDFGDEESRNTMLGKGQFYWQDPLTRAPVPVDNFVFRTSNGWELKVAGVSHRSVLSLSSANYARFEWFDDYAAALLRMADLLEGSTAIGDFGAPAGAEDAVEDLSGPGPDSGTGGFVVKCIHEYDDVLDAPVLTYTTGEGAQVQLTTDRVDWAVQLRDAQGNWHRRQFAAGQRSEALRSLAGALKGTLRCGDFERAA